MQELIKYIKNPQEYCSYTFNIKTMFMSVFFCLTIPLACKLIIVIPFVLMGIGLPQMSSDKSTLPLWFLLFIPPIIEELGFRLPLKRNRWSLNISIAIIAFVFSKLIFAGNLYTNYLVERILFAIIVSMAANYFLWSMLARVNFKNFFYGLAILFAVLHIINFSHQTLTSVQWLYVVCYACAKIPGSILYGYIRMKHGMLFCVVIHIINNLPLLVIL